MDDLISRQAAIDEIDKWIVAFRENGHKESAADACLIQDGIIQLLSAQPEQKTGLWVPHIEKSREYIGTVLVNVRYDYWLCDTCGYRVKNGQPMYNYCPNCGAKMEVIKDD